MRATLIVAMVVISFGAAIFLGLIDFETKTFGNLLTGENLPFLFIAAFLAFVLQMWLVGMAIILVKAGRRISGLRWSSVE